jgi:hypothetical protein
MYNEYKYTRELPTGFGDRLGCIICVAALAKAIDLAVEVNENTKQQTKIHLFWCEKSNNKSAAHRFYPFSEISKYITFPSNLIFHSKEELELLDYPTLSWQNGELPATFAYDCIPTLAHKTFDQTNFKYKIDSPTYKLAYTQIATEVTIKNIDFISELPKNYGVLHVRGGDKANWSPAFIDSSVQIVQQLSNHGFNNWVLVTDDKQSFEFFPNICKTISKDFQICQEQSEITEIFRDTILLLNANFIVQHVSDGWSAFSNIPASLRNIPIINTYPFCHNSLLKSFYHLGGKPHNYHECQELSTFISKIQSDYLL